MVNIIKKGTWVKVTQPNQEEFIGMVVQVHPNFQTGDLNFQTTGEFKEEVRTKIKIDVDKPVSMYTVERKGTREKIHVGVNYVTPIQPPF